MTVVCRASMAVNEMTDAEFDALLPPAVRRVSCGYWTSVAIARRAAAIFEDLGVSRVLDVGSGPGKFCVVAAARAPRLAFVGVEHRPHLVTIARSLARAAGIANVTFSADDAKRVSWTGFDGFYVYDSFAENDFDAEDQFDNTVELSHARHLVDARRVARRLATAPIGSVVVTYHSLSGPIPGSYGLVHVEAAGTGWLRAWRKETAEARGKYWLEEGADVTRWTGRPEESKDNPPRR